MIQPSPAEGAGIASPGFAVSDFATEFPTNARFGPMGLAFDSHGALFTVDNTDGNLYKFSSAGGAAAQARVSATPIPGYLVGLAFDKDGNLYVAREEVENGGDVAQINPSNGAVERVVASGFKPLGITTDPVSGDLFVTVVGEPIKRISGQTSESPTVTDYGERLSTPDGIVFGPDGTLYTEDEGNIISITGTASPTPGVATTVGYVAGADGIAVAETTNPSEKPFLAVNSNDGSITKVDLATNPATYTSMVTGGSRGDLTAVGPDSCLYATQFESIEKVTAGNGTCPFYPSSPFHCSDKIGAVSPTTGVHVAIGDGAATTVTITGKSYCPGTQVQFGNTSAIASATVQSPSTLMVTVPNDATSGELKLTDPYGNTGEGVPYVINNYRDDDGFQFLNDLGVGPDLSWSDMTAAFGSNAYQRWSLCGGCISIPVPNLEAVKLYLELRAGGLNGLCFGFSLGSLKLSQGVDKLAASPGERSDPLWNQPTVWDLPPFETASSPYGAQMRHYLYQQAMRQFSTQNYALNVAYLDGLKHYATQARLGAYVEQQVSSAFSHGLPIIEIFIRRGGHALVGYSMQTHPDGSFDIDVYDPDDPFQASENGDGEAHDAKLQSDRIHVQPNGSWSYTGGLGATWVGPARDMRVLPFSSLSGALDPLDNAKGYVATRGPISQIVDGHGHSLYSAQGLVPEDQRPGDIDLLNPITGTAPTTSATTGLLLNSSGRYTETFGGGVVSLVGDDLTGQVTDTGGGKLDLGTGGDRVQLIPAAVGPATLQLTHDEPTGQTTVTVSGRLHGAATLDVGEAATMDVARAAYVSVSVTRVGSGQPPQTFRSAVRLSAGQQLQLGPLLHLDLTAPTIHATVSRHGHRRRVTLINRMRHPAVRIIRVSTTRTHGTLRVTVRLAARAPHGGQVVVTVRDARGRSATVTAAVRARIRLSVLLPAQHHRERLRIWAVALSSRGEAGRVTTTTAKIR